MRSNKSIAKSWRKSIGGAGKYAMLLLLLSPAIARAQRLRVYNNGIWGGYFTHTELGKEYSLITELELKTRQWTNRWHEQDLDIGVEKKLNAKWRAGAGAAYYHTAQYFDELFYRSEWRLWQEGGYILNGKKLSFVQRLKVDERWIQEVSNGKKLDKYDYITRLRYKTELQKPLHQGKITPVFGNELMINPFNLGTDKAFDQNRTWLGVNLKLASTITLQCHFMKIYQWRTGNILDNQNIIRINFVQHFNVKNA